MTTRVIQRPRRAGRSRAWQPAAGCAIALAILALGAVAITTLLRGQLPFDSTNTYPIDYFAEMHYQKYFRAMEPPRLLPPDTIVPVEGRAPFYTREEMVELENPLPPTEDVLELGARVYSVNCQVCHGPEGDGRGRMWSFFPVAGAPPPADLTSERIAALPDGYLYSVITLGFGEYMPAYGDLLPEDHRWALVWYIRALADEGIGNREQGS